MRGNLQEIIVRYSLIFFWS